MRGMPGDVTNVEVDPIRCWWRTSTGSIRTGENFNLSLTCATLDTEAVQVVPDESRLGAAVIAMAPFEVVGGSHPADIRSGQRRFFQYQYTLRIINPDMIGRDVRIPDLAIHFRVNSRIAQNASLQGRDLVYLLPVQSVKVTSMVPGDAPDIRDAAGEDFGVAENLGFRASVLEIVAMTAVALGVLMVILVLVGLARRSGARTPASQRMLPTWKIVRTARQALASVQRDREQQGWTAEHVGRAIAATRIVAAVALGRTVTQRLADPASTATEGRLVTAGRFRSKARVLSSPVTVHDLSSPSNARTSDQPTLDALKDALATFSAPQYGREASMDAGALDRALTGAGDAASRVSRDHSWIREFFRQVRAGGRTVESQAL